MHGAGWPWVTTSVAVTAGRVEVVNAFRTISVPLAHVIRLEPPMDSRAAEGARDRLDQADNV